ncbi:hypothetical protein P148_SR1C00001G0185 [candidate division SR1 bacterium RAAC1_SR1_1]|nr:hypothetical protein P148_SR1C00001G0185 [candidate division SR1 bacterium RAAC1_SR1_1]
MHKLINPNYHEILNVYTKERPAFLLPFLESKTMQRLSDISQACGTDYCKFYNYKFKQSRLDHSLGVALIIWHFTKDQTQTLAGLFHDVSHSVFSHVGDYLMGDTENQESSEQHTTKLLSEDEVIMRELEKLGIALEDVDDYTKYTIADNPGPKLSADRLEYTLSIAITLSTKSIEEITEMYNDLRVLTNEKGEEEIGFGTKDIAEKFAILSIANDEGCYSCYDSVVAQNFLSEILRYMLVHKIISPMQLYTRTESELIDKINQSNDAKLLDMWNYFTQMSQYKIYRYKPTTDQYFVSSKVKRRFIDPLVWLPNGNKRVSELSEIFVDMRDYHLKRREERIRINYKLA